VKSVGFVWKDFGGLAIMSKILEYANEIVPCQRNWDESYQIPEQEIKYITDVATIVPTKQQRSVFSLIAITNREAISEIFKICYDKQDRENTFKKNSQVRANLLLVWTSGPYPYNGQSLGIAVGISSSAAALAGAELGYKTGFCKCFVAPQARDILEKYVGKLPGKEVPLMLGIGKPDENFDTRDVAINGVLKSRKGTSGNKYIPVHRLT
jgi:nitroreductase